MSAVRLAAALTILALAGCKSSVQEVPPGFTYADRPQPMRLIEGPSVPPPANDISEQERLAWLDSYRPRSEPERVERVVVRDRRPARQERCADRDWGWGWALPLTLSLGYWSGHGHDDHGWGWGVNWNSGWWW